MNAFRLAAIPLAASVMSLARADVISFPDFSDVSSLQLNGVAAQAFDGAQNVLRLTPSAPTTAGSAFTKNPVGLPADGSFNTTFSFRFSQPVSGGADGIVFVVQPNANTALGFGASGIGYSGIGNSVGVELDTFDNGEGAAAGNHVGIDINGSLTHIAAANLDALGQLDQGDIWWAWVDYDGVSDILDVRLNTNPARPGPATLSAPVDLPGILGGSSAFVGFTSGTGGAANTHDVLTWGFRTPDVTPNPGIIPEPGTWSAGLISAVGAFGFFLHRRRQRHGA